MKSIFISRNFKKFSNKLPKNKIPKKFNWKLLGKVAAIFAGVGFVSVAGVFLYFAKDLPSPGKVNSRFLAESTKIYDRTGETLLYEVHGEEKRTVIPFEEIPDTVKYASIALEDQDFYSHHGIKITSIIRAALKDVMTGERAQGGSTITQQFVKKSLLSDEKTITRKIKEAILSIEIEQKFSKDEILEMYLNEIPYGSNAYGVEAAAQTFFNKHARELTLDEAAMLASLPQAPSRYSPYGSYTERLKTRQEKAIQEMANLGYITQEQADEAKKVDVLSKVVARREDIKAPHFVMYIKEYLEEKYGEEAVEKGGLKVYTTLDWDKQQAAEKAVAEGAEKNKTWNATNAALVAIDVKTGQILSMVGSKDYFDKTIDGQVNVTIRERQPGSSFKPYVYLTAFTKGYTPDTILFDVPTNFGTGDKDYEPQNYDGEFRGPIKMKEALPQSLNIPAVKALYLAGEKNAILMAKKLGITTLNQPDRYGLSLVLGGGEVKLLDHVNAFATLGNGGVYHGKTAILRIEDSSGEILEQYQETSGDRVVEEEHVAMLDHVLSTNKYRAPVFGQNNSFRFDTRQVVAKTGTTNEFRDGWAMGYTPSIAVGVWVGNSNNDAMKPGADGSIVAAPIWRSFMDQVLPSYPIEKFPDYEQEETGKDILDGELDIKEDVKVCEIERGDNEGEYCLANKYCTSDDEKKRDFANVHSILHYVQLEDPRGDEPNDPGVDPQYKNWEKGIKKWYEKEEDDYIFGKIPKNECSASDFEGRDPSVALTLSRGDSAISISVKADAPYDVEKMEILINGSVFASTGDDSYSGTYSYQEKDKEKEVDISVKLKDKVGNEATSSKKIKL